MLRRLGIAFAAVGCLGAGPAPSTTPDQLIAQLGAKEYRAREAAARALAQRGEGALPAMRFALSTADPEIRRRLRQLIDRVEREGLLRPKLVTLHVEQKAVGKVFEELAQQTGYTLTCQQGDAQLVTFDCENVPFWQAIDQVCRQSGHGLQPYYDTNAGLQFSKLSRPILHVQYSGPFRISAGSFNWNKTVDLNAQPQTNPLARPGTESLTFMFNVIGEPKTPLMSLGQPRVIQAVDEAGNSLAPPQNRGYEAGYHNYYYGYRNPLHQSQVQLLGHGGARTLQSLRISLPITFLAEQRPEITVEHVLKVKNQKFESPQVAFEIDEVKEVGKQVHIRATARRNGSENQHDYTWTNSLGQRVELFDESGNKFRADGFNWDSGTPTAVTGTFQFSEQGNAKVGKAAKFVYYNWITSQTQLDFEFRDLPLP